VFNLSYLDTLSDESLSKAEEWTILDGGLKSGIKATARTVNDGPS
jgi:hypothetical protein